MMVAGLGMLLNGNQLMAQSNNVAIATNAPTISSTIATNLNGVVIDILQGVHVAGGEIYQAPKEGIVKAIDFTSEQAPMVVKEFLDWKLTEAILWFIFYVAIAVVLFYFSLKVFKDGRKQGDGELLTIGAFGLLASFVITFLNFIWNILDIAQILVAPKVFLIEYVAHIIKHTGH